MLNLQVYLSVLRLKHAPKQIVILFPLLINPYIFGETKNLTSLFFTSSLAIMVWTLFATAIYVVNDLFDLERDKLDPIKKHKPIAKSEIRKGHALIIFCSLTSLGIVVLSVFNTNVIAKVVLLFYFAINILYSGLHLKKFNLLGAIVVAAGYPLRFAFGCLVFELPQSPWALSLLSTLSLFIVSTKRLERLIRQKNTDTLFWLVMSVLFCTSSISLYVAFISSAEMQDKWSLEALLISLVLFVLGVARFIEMVLKEVDDNLDISERIFSDGYLFIFGSLFILSFALGGA